MLASLAESVDATQIMLLDQSGNVLSSAFDPRYDFTDPRFDALRGAFRGEGDAAFAEAYESDDTQLRYYAEKINDELEIVVEQNLAALAGMVDFGMSWKAIFSPTSASTSALHLVFSDDAHQLLYTSDNALEGMSAEALGFTRDDLADGSMGWKQIGGKRYFCGVSHVESMGCSVVYADAENMMLSGEWFTVSTLLLIGLMVLILFAFYGSSQMAALRKSADGRTSREERNGLIRRLATLGALSLMVMFGVSYYMQTLSAYSKATYANNQQVETLKGRLEASASNAQALTQWYEDGTRDKAEMVREIIAYSSALSDATYESLTQLAEAIDATEIALFSEQGDLKIVGGQVTDISIKDNAYNPLRELSALLNGASYASVIVEDAHGCWQYVGVGGTSYGATGNLVVLRLDRTRLTDLLASTAMGTLLDGVHSTADSFAMAVSKASGAFVYHPNDSLIGKPALAHGLLTSQMREGYCGYLTVDGETCYARCMENDAYFFYVASPIDHIDASRWPFSAMATALTGLCLLALSLLLCHVNRKLLWSNGDAPSEANPARNRMSNLLNTGMVKFRLTSSGDAWRTQGIGHRTMMLTKWMLAAYAFLFACAIALRRYIFSPYSIVRYVMDGEWEKGLNLFSVTAALFTAFGIATVATIAVWVIRMMEPLLSQKGRTICRLTANAVKYATVILAVYYCLSLFGVNTPTLLASAGVLTGIIGLGSRQIISDIMSGLFLIFEGGFQVGDTVQIGDCKGVVTDIGIRVTKVRGPEGSLNIIPNGSIAGVTNLSRVDSAIVISHYIDYNEAFERVQAVLERELPLLAQRYPAIRSGPAYLGVTEMTPLRYTIGVLIKCDMADSNALRRSLTTEIYEILKRNGIQMGYRQNTPLA